MKLLMIMALWLSAFAMPVAAESRLETAKINSVHFAHNRIGVSSVHDVTVYLPDGYATSKKRYPVIYFLNSFGEDETAPFANNGAQAVFDAAMTDGTIGDVIVVTADFLTPLGMSWYVNSPVTGNWQDFMVRELVPYIDRNYRTLAKSESRGIAGDRMGGYGAIRFGMAYPDVFGAVYALHPVGTSNGVKMMQARPDWDRLHSAKTLDDVKADIYSQIFTTIYQAHLPNPDKPPLFVDLPATGKDATLSVDADLIARLQQSYFLDQLISQYANNLKRLRGFKFDWGRNDTLYDHVYGNQKFAYMLEEYGVPYEAEEFRGWWGERHWGPDGRVMTDVLPFFNSTLVFQ
jgi:S-formylglutathione hydrolase FrmB